MTKFQLFQEQFEAIGYKFKNVHETTHQIEFEINFISSMFFHALHHFYSNSFISIHPKSIEKFINNELVTINYLQITITK